MSPTPEKSLYYHFANERVYRPSEESRDRHPDIGTIGLFGFSMLFQCGLGLIDRVVGTDLHDRFGDHSKKDSMLAAFISALGIITSIGYTTFLSMNLLEVSQGNQNKAFVWGAETIVEKFDLKYHTTEETKNYCREFFKEKTANILELAKDPKSKDLAEKILAKLQSFDVESELNKLEGYNGYWFTAGFKSSVEGVIKQAERLYKDSQYSSKDGVTSASSFKERVESSRFSSSSFRAV